MPGLFTGNVQTLAEDLPITAGLIQKIDKIAVFKDIFDLRRCQQILDILRDAGGDLM